MGLRLSAGGVALFCWALGPAVPARASDPAAESYALVLETLRQKASEAPDAPLDLVVWLKSRPGPRIARDLHEGARPELDRLRARAQALHRSLLPSRSLSPQEEREFMARFSSEGGAHPFHTPEQRAALTKLGRQAEARLLALQGEFNRRVQRAQAVEQKWLKTKVASLEGRIEGWIASQNAAHVVLPARGLEELLKEPLVARVMPNAPATFELDVSRQAVDVAGFWDRGIGGGIWDAGVLDSGVTISHPAFAGINFLDFGNGAGDGAGGAGHGTPITGILASRDATFRGLAFGMQTVLISRLTDSASSQVQADWMTSGAGGDNAEAINLSGGFGRANDADYTQFDQFWDGLTDDRFALVSKSAGNGGSAAKTLTHPGSAFNVITVGEMRDQGTPGRDDDRITSSSGRGPTLNGRKKPDLVAPGASIRTTSRRWAGNNADFENVSGSSFSAPHVTAGAILLTDLRVDPTPVATKAVLINTADAWTANGPAAGSVWNSAYGWGYLNLGAAAFHAHDVFQDVVDDGVTPPGPDYKLFRGVMFPGEKATLVWNRHIGYDGSNLPTSVEALSDLDLVVWRASDNTMLTKSESHADNVEQVALGGSVAEDVLLKVSVFQTLDPDVGEQRFALATQENFSRATIPTFRFAPSVNHAGGGLMILRLSVTNDGSVNAFANQITVSGFFSGSVFVQTLAPGETRTFNFSASCSGPGSFIPYSYDILSVSYGDFIRGRGNRMLSCP